MGSKTEQSLGMKGRKLLGTFIITKPGKCEFKIGPLEFDQEV